MTYEEITVKVNERYNSDGYHTRILVEDVVAYLEDGYCDYLSEEEIVYIDEIQAC